MSFNNLKYDNCAYTHQLKESVSPGDYMLNTPKPCKPCFVASPGVNLGGFGASICDNLVDVDSELMNITRKASDCPSKHYLPGETYNGNVCGKMNKMIECADDSVVNFLTAEDTLISNPKCTNKERTVNRWEWLCRQPQDNAIRPFDWYIANRLVVKDSHRPLVPTLLDQSSALPPKKTNKCSTYLDEQFTNTHTQWKKTNNGPQNAQWKYDNIQYTNCDKVHRL
jgi:hypothetical protein